jgi:hypothetical protein
MSNDIRSILDRLATVEGRLSPAQQKVPQLPALFKPKHIRALGSKTDPAHPMDGYMVGDSVEPTKTALEEAMAEIEEDMISKVKKDLTQYLDRLEKKVNINRDLKDKAKDAVQKRQPEEIEEFAPSGDDGQEPDEEEILRKLAAMWWNGTEQQMARAQDTLAAMGWEIGQDESGDDDAGVFLVQAGDVNGNSYMAFPHSELDLNENTSPAATFEMADGIALECWGDDNTGYELRRGDKTLPSRFKNMDDAGMAVKLYQARKQKQQRPDQDLSQDYIEER